MTHQTDSNIIFSNIEQTRTCSSYGNRTRTPYFWLWTIKHRTSNIVLPITINLDWNSLSFKPASQQLQYDYASMPPPQRGNWRLTQFCGQQVLLLKEESNKWPKKRAFGVCGVHLTNGPPQCLTPERQGLNPKLCIYIGGEGLLLFQSPLKWILQVR